MDQAETLRKLMLERESDAMEAAQTPVLLVSSASAGEGKSALIEGLERAFVRSGKRVLSIDTRTPDARQAYARYSARTDLILAEVEPRFFDAARPETRRREAWRGLPGLLVVTPQTPQNTFNLAENSQIGVIVNRASDGGEGRNWFRQLTANAPSPGPAERPLIEYLGHCPTSEKNIQSVMKKLFLLDLGMDSPGLTWLAKRVQNRFMEEPAHKAQGNAARFWRALLDEGSV